MGYEESPVVFRCRLRGKDEAGDGDGGKIRFAA